MSYNSSHLYAIASGGSLFLGFVWGCIIVTQDQDQDKENKKQGYRSEMK